MFDRGVKPKRYRVRVGDTVVRYQAVGEGEPVVLVHGLAGSTRWWVRSLPALAKHYRVYMVDLPGFGRQRGRRRLVRWWRKKQGFELARAADWLGDWMEATGVGPAHLVGHSMGGYICLKLSTERPRSVRRLVLVSPAGVPTGRSIPGYFVPFLATSRYVDPKFLNIWALDVLRAGPSTLFRATREIVSEDVREELANASSPTLLVWGRHDDLVPLELGEALREGIPDSRLLVLEKAGHVPMFEQTEDFNEAVTGFLSGGPVGS